MGLKVTEVKFRPYRTKNLAGFADVTFNDELTLKSCTVWENDGVITVGPPSFKDGNGDYQYTAFFEDELKSYLGEEVTPEYEKADKSPASRGGGSGGNRDRSSGRSSNRKPRQRSRSFD